MARYECVEGGSAKFWEITLSGNTFTTRWGRLGGAGQSKTQEFGDAQTAQHEHDKLTASKLKKGYVLVGGPAETERRIFVRLETPEYLTHQWRELTLEGRVLRQRSGWNTMEMEDKTEKLPSAAAARAAFDQVLARCLDNSFEERQRTEEELAQERLVPSKLAEHKEMEAAVLGAPDDPRVAAVYADFLQSHGDVRGELATLRVGGQEAQAARLLERHAAFLWGEAAPRAEQEVIELAWQHGLLRGVTLKMPGWSAGGLAELTTQVLAAPLGRLLTSLRFGLASRESDNDWGPVMEAVTASDRVTQLRSLRFDAFTSDDCELSWTPFGDFSTAWSHLAALEHLKIRSGDGGILGKLELPSLRTFIRESGGLSAAELESITHARWPLLGKLELWTGSGEYGAEGTVDLLQPLLEGRGLPKLRHLGIVDCEFVHELLPALATSKILPRLASLDLSKGAMIGTDAATLVKLAPAFAHLESIDLSENQLDAEAQVRLREVLPQVKLDDQRDDEGEGQRYVAVGE